MSRRKSGARARSKRGALNGSASAESVQARADSLTAALESGVGYPPDRGGSPPQVASRHARAHA